MSTSGLASGKGIDYQRWIACEWVVRMLYDESIAKIETESTRIQNGESVKVDDCIVHGRDGSVVYMQCKSNNSRRSHWTFSDLSDDLAKAWEQWVNSSGKTSMHFYSEDPFGDLVRLSTKARDVDDDASFRHLLPNDLMALYRKFKVMVGLDVEESRLWLFLRTLEFQVKLVDDVRQSLSSRLSSMITFADKAEAILFTMVSNASSRAKQDASDLFESPSAFLTKEKVVERLNQKGIWNVQPYNKQEIVSSLHDLSLCGRDWIRSIGEKKRIFPELPSILDQIVRTDCSVVIHGEAGIGKTCFLLDLAEALEREDNVFCLFLQTRDYGDLEIGNWEHAGLPLDLEGRIARMAEYEKVVVVLDSMDALSIGKCHSSLKRFCRMVGQLRLMRGVSIVAACRSFDLDYDANLSCIQWDEKVRLNGWQWDEDMKHFFSDHGWDEPDEAQKSLLSNPRLLSLYYTMRVQGTSSFARTEAELIEAYLHHVSTRDYLRTCGNVSEIRISLERMALTMLEGRRLDLPVLESGLSEHVESALQSAGILLKNDRGNLMFRHQTFVDVLVVSSIRRAKKTLSQWLRDQPPVPFIRPTVRAYIFHLRQMDMRGFRQQIRQFLVADGMAFHFKRLVVESMAEMDPVEDDWPLIRSLFQDNEKLFHFMYVKAKRTAWLPIWRDFLFPSICRDHDRRNWVDNYVFRLGVFYAENADAVVAYWLEILEQGIIDKRSTAQSIAHALSTQQPRQTPEFRRLIQKILPLCTEDKHGYSSFSSILMKWVDQSDTNDDVLFQYIVHQLKDQTVDSVEILEKNLRVSPKYFRGDNDFLYDRLLSSDWLIENIIELLIQWETDLKRAGQDVRLFGKLDHTQQRDSLDGDNINFRLLIRYVCQACVYRIQTSLTWWERQGANLMQVRETSLIGYYILAYTMNEGVGSNVQDALSVFRWHLNDKRAFLWVWRGKILSHIAYRMEDNDLEDIQSYLLHLAQDSQDSALIRICYYLHCIPSYWRLVKTHEFLSIHEKNGISWDLCLECTKIGEIKMGKYSSPVKSDRLISLSDQSILRILELSEKGDDWRSDQFESWDCLPNEFLKVAEIAPQRMLIFLRNYWSSISLSVRSSILHGCAWHVRYRTHSLSSDTWKPVEEPDIQHLALSLLAVVENHSHDDLEELSICEVLYACCEIVERNDYGMMKRLVSLLRAYAYDNNPKLNDMLNTTVGKVLEGSMRMAAKGGLRSEEIKGRLWQVLLTLVTHPSLAVRQALMKQGAMLIHSEPEKGWGLFEYIVSQNPTCWEWEETFTCLWHHYRNYPARIQTCLASMWNHDAPKMKNKWAKIQALCCLEQLLTLQEWKEVMEAHDHVDAWKGATAVCIHNGCDCDANVASLCLEIMRHIAGKCGGERHQIVETMYESLQVKEMYSSSWIRFICLLSSEDDQLDMYGEYGWQITDFLRKVCSEYPESVLPVVEMLERNLTEDERMYRSSKDVAVILTDLFRYGEELELQDNGAFLSRVLTVQDSLFAKGLQLDDWLDQCARVE